MRLNFWQWLGLVLLVLGVAWFALRGRDEPSAAPPPMEPGSVTTAPAR
jgi:drug/metabolite transporter (DMT)-like permease